MLGFNSTLVRLEAVRGAGKDRDKVVSIPLWFDWKKGHSPINEVRDQVSIPLWFDWKAPVPPPAATLATVSIPLWFDWKLNLCWN